MDGVKRKSWKAKSLVDRSNFSRTPLYNGNNAKCEEVVDWRTRDIFLLSPKHDKKRISVQSQKIVRTCGESGKREAVDILLQTDEGLDLLSETKQQHSDEDFKAANKWGDLQTFCGSRILAASHSRTSDDLQLGMMRNTQP